MAVIIRHVSFFCGRITLKVPEIFYKKIIINPFFIIIMNQHIVMRFRISRIYKSDLCLIRTFGNIKY